MLPAISLLLATMLVQPEPKPAPAPADLATLEPIPHIELPPSPPLTDQESKHIHDLIDALAQIDKPDYGMSPTTFGSAFAALPELTRFQGGIIMIDHQHETSSPFVELIKLGPKAMPALLEALADERPTKLEMKHDRGFGAMWSAHEMGGNPMNEREWAALAKLPRLGEFGEGDTLRSHTVTIGDVCFTIIGQITGRGYSTVRYQPTACIVINSPTLDHDITKSVREIWTAQDSSPALFNSLLIDFFTRGIHKGQYLDHWSQGAGLQVPAATRLLYYFPDQTASLVASRLDGLDVSDTAPSDLDADIKQTVANGVRAFDFIDAVAWSDRPEIRCALQRMATRTDDPEIFLKCAAAVPPQDKDAASKRLLNFIAKLPADEGAPFGSGYHLIIALAKLDPDRARDVYRDFTTGCMHRRRTVCHAVQQAKPAWGCEVLLPLLDDKQNADWWNHAVNPDADEPRVAIRVCDEAADAIHELRPDLDFEMVGTQEALDGKIEAIKKALAAPPPGPH